MHRAPTRGRTGDHDLRSCSRQTGESSACAVWPDPIRRALGPVPAHLGRDGRSVPPAGGAARAEDADGTGSNLWQQSQIMQFAYLMMHNDYSSQQNYSFDR